MAKRRCLCPPARTDGTLIPAPLLPRARRRLVKRCQKPDRVSAGPLIASRLLPRAPSPRGLATAPSYCFDGRSGSRAARTALRMGQHQLTAGGGGQAQAERLCLAGPPRAPLPAAPTAQSSQQPQPAGSGQPQPVPAGLTRLPSNGPSPPPLSPPPATSLCLNTHLLFPPLLAWK